jgi:hypothetical protein
MKKASVTMKLSRFLALLLLFQSLAFISAGDDDDDDDDHSGDDDDDDSARFDSSDNPFGCVASCPALIAGNGEHAGVPRSLMTIDKKDCNPSKCTANVGYYFKRGYICVEDCVPQESSSSDRRRVKEVAEESADE